MSETTQKPTQQQQTPRGLGELVIEIATPKNATVRFPPISESLRGRWDNRNLPVGMRSERGLLQMPVIPGVHVRIDPAKGEGEVTDPLEHDPQLMQRISDVYTGLDRQKRRPRAPIRRKLKPEEVATWLVWMVRLLESSKAVKVRGADITLNDIKRAYPGVKVQMVWSASMQELPEVAHRAIEDLVAA